LLTVHLARPFGALGLMLLALLLRQDSPAPARTSVIMFIGAQARDKDPVFAAFSNALYRQTPPRTAVPKLEHVEGAATDVAMRAKAAAHAAANGTTKAIVAPTADDAAAVARLEKHPPIVFASSLDPVRIGIVQSLRHPGGHTTGVSLHDDLTAKRLELLSDAFPRLRRIAVLADSWWLATHDVKLEAMGVAQLRGLELRVLSADTVQELEQAMGDKGAGWADAWVILPTYIAYVAERSIIAHLELLRRPAIHSSEQEMAAGALMAYSQDTSFAYDALAKLALRVAAGEDAGSIPIERPMRFTLSVRPRTDNPALVIHPDVIRRADRVY
jgi:putative tryptophan/tyrosine transport system substrate-binding protein